MSLQSDASRFANRTSELLYQLSRPQTSAEVSIADILAATKSELSHIASDRLHHASVLGQGTSFRVTREEYHKRGASPYYVAVKRFLTPQNGPKSGHYQALLRELRLLMHLPLRTHGCIVQAVAYGWTESTQGLVQPYLIMDYSDHGNLIDYLRRCKIPIDERRELALDVASALKALHDCKVVHGDIKPENVLIYDNNDYEGMDIIRPQVARLADFGGSIIEQDFDFLPEIAYLGTPKYLAPEIAGYIKGTGLCPFEIYKKADCYSLGLLIWETMKNGQSYIDPASRKPGESVESFLERIISSGKDVLCGLALAYCDTTEDMIEHTVIGSAIKGTLAMCLKDNPSERALLEDVIQTLAKGTRLQRPRLDSHKGLKNPIGTAMPAAASMNGDALQRPQAAGAFYTLMPITTDDFIVRPFTEGNLPVVQDSCLLPHITNKNADSLKYGTLDIFRMAMTEPLPWRTQCELASQMLRFVAPECALDETKKAHAHLQLAVMYHVGYGLEPNDSQALEHLLASSYADPVGKALYNPVSRALQPKATYEKLDEPAEMMQSNFFRALRLPPITVEPEVRGGVNEYVTVHELSPLSSLVLRDNWDGDKIGPYDISAALSAACRKADFVVAKSLARCNTALSYDHDQPNALHWLIMFNGFEAAELLDLIVSPSQNRLLLEQGSGKPLYFPSQCIELFGTPLHWAVRTGNSDLVSLLIKHGADINARWKSRVPKSSEPPLGRYQPSFSPLDLAVAYHFADIVQMLLGHGGEVVSDDREWGYTCFHMIAQPTLPFSRFVAHGEHHRSACRRTIAVLQSHGADINATDSNGDTPLTLSIRSFDIESYILEELISAGSTACSEFDAKHGSMIIKAARFCSDRLFSTSQARLLVPLVDDLNRLDPDGRNALHYCAIADAVRMAKVLQRTGKIRINQAASDGHTALTYAAIFGSVDMINYLVEAGADTSLASAKGATALELAVSRRHIRASVALIKAGAQLSFASENILHIAVTNRTQRGSIALELLDQCREQLAVKSILDGFDSGGWTPMHCAAYCGDFDGIEALLYAGADPLAYKYPSYYSNGGNPLELVTKTINWIKAKGLGNDHSYVKANGQKATLEFLSRLKRIANILSEQMSPQ